ncbi:MAG: M43 family zinc metalloprotease, partial [Flavobacteriales bacterium]
MKKSILFFLLTLTLNVMNGQHITHFCGQQIAHERMCSHHPEAVSLMREARENLEAETRNFTENRGGGMVIYTIPVVFHIIHNNGPENISNDQIYDAVAILNRDFRKLNADTSSIVAAFQDIAADVGVEFALAAKDPNGNCHPGINRVMSPLTNDGGSSDMKALSYWPRDEYMNIWVCAEAGDGVAGFTYNPGDVGGFWGYSEDGIVMRSDYIGAIGTSSEGRSRTLTHEVGHWLNLDHTWGNSNSPGDPNNCDMDDNVNDTPNTIGHTSCNLSAGTCGSVQDNVQNYMEYSYCSRMFTQGQANRMRAALLSSTADRNQLWTNGNLAATGVLNPPLCAAVFSTEQISGCVGAPIQFFDQSYHNVETWNWDFGDGTALSCSDPNVHKNPEHIFLNPGNYSVTLTVSNSTGTVTSNNNFVMAILPASGIVNLQEGFENSFPSTNWIINNPDADETWEVSPSAATSGIKSLKIRNFTIDEGRVDEFISTTFDMSQADSVLITYSWAYANMISTSDDRLKISVSGNCGETWSLRKMRRGTTNLPTADAT